MPPTTILDFPLQGEWFAPNTPGTRVPSHGTDLLGETYAFDFVGLAPGGRDFKFYRPSLLHYLLNGVRLDECYGWGRPILAASAGTVIQAEDGLAERNPVNLARDAAVMRANARAFNRGMKVDYHALAGNFIIVETADGYAVYAHCRAGSLRVAAGERVEVGQRLADVGHSGNSTAPHLHFQLMDHPDPWRAKGLPCCFRAYEVYEKGAWREVQNGIPTSSQRIRRSYWIRIDGIFPIPGLYLEKKVEHHHPHSEDGS